jgi:hypothetical protein
MDQNQSQGRYENGLTDYYYHVVWKFKDDTNIQGEPRTGLNGSKPFDWSPSMGVNVQGQGSEREMVQSTIHGQCKRI